MENTGKCKKDINNDLGMANIAANQSGKGQSSFPSYLDSIDPQRERLFSQEVNKTFKFTARSDHAMLRELLHPKLYRPQLAG